VVLVGDAPSLCPYLVLVGDRKFDSTYSEEIWEKEYHRLLGDILDRGGTFSIPTSAHSTIITESNLFIDIIRLS
jgi:hypothetical protein